MPFQNIVPGVLVNGSMGKVIGFISGPEAHEQGIGLTINEPKEDEYHRQAYIRKVLQSLGKGQWPLVRFDNWCTKLCVPRYFDVSDHEGKVRATRHQV